MNKLLEEGGAPPLAPGQPVPDPLLQARALVEQAERKLKSHADAQARARARAASKRKAVPQNKLSQNDIAAQLRQILLDPNETGTSRIQAARTLLEIDGTAPQYQKTLIQVELTHMAPNQAELDKARYDATPDATGSRV